MTTVLFFLLTTIPAMIYAQKPGNGTYSYSIAWTEHSGRSLGATCTVVVRGDSIKVLHDGKANVTGRQGDIYAVGLIMKHTRTGRWIIGKSPADKDAKEIGGCSDGPSVIDFRRRKFWRC